MAMGPTLVAKLAAIVTGPRHGKLRRQEEAARGIHRSRHFEIVLMIEDMHR